MLRVKVHQRVDLVVLVELLLVRGRQVGLVQRVRGESVAVQLVGEMRLMMQLLLLLLLLVLVEVVGHRSPVGGRHYRII